MKELVKWHDVKSHAQGLKSGVYDSDVIYGNASFNRLVVTDLAESWDDFLEWSSRLRNRGFRGQMDASLPLQSSLEREIKVDRSYGDIRGSCHFSRKIADGKLLSDFRKLAPLHLPDLPSNDDQAGWLALMQHYGGPTGLLDWTECPFVGMYFALLEEPKGVNRSAVWAIDLDWLQRKEREMLGNATPIQDLRTRINYKNSLIDESEKLLVVRIDPEQRNARMVAQKGFFLWKLYRDTPLFDEMLMVMMLHPEIVQSPVIRKLEVSPELRNDFLERLSREKGIHKDTLFPGTNFCEQLKVELWTMVAEYEQELRSIQVGKVVDG
jgi:hypothetical protein